jgi:hypothetical protein
MTMIRCLTAAAFLAVAAINPASAADPIFPPGARVGMVPLVGLNRAKSFIGFETDEAGAKVVIADLPIEAYDEVANAFKSNPGGIGGVKPQSIETGTGLGYYTVENARDGDTNVRRYSMIMPGIAFAGYVAVQIPESAWKIYSDDAVRQMFASAIVRKEVPADEQLALLSFKVSERGDFKHIRTLAPGAAIILADADETAGFEAAPFMIVGIIGQTAASPDARSRLAQQIAATIPGVREGRITMSEPVRIDGQPGYETRIEGTSGKDNTPVTIVQWLRFGSQSAMRIVGSSPRDQWTRAFPRFRSVRDGIQPRG